MVVPRRAASSRSCCMTVSSIFSVVFLWTAIRLVFRYVSGVTAAAAGPRRAARAPTGAILRSSFGPEAGAVAVRGHAGVAAA